MWRSFDLLETKVAPKCNMRGNFWFSWNFKMHRLLKLEYSRAKIIE